MYNMEKGTVVQGDTAPIPGKEVGMSERIVCDKCGKEFKNGRGLAGHMAGVHGVKWGMNATLEGMRQELDEVKVALVFMAKAMSEGGAVEKRYVYLAQKKACRQPNVCGVTFVQEDAEMSRLERLIANPPPLPTFPGPDDLV